MSVCHQRSQSFTALNLVAIHCFYIWFHRRYGIPAFTYELGDEADRQLLHETTPVFAEEMMRELLNAEKPGE